MIFVFGSNKAGRHGKGAAAYARRCHGAIYGRGFGLQSNSYAIPTKDEYLKTLPIETIAAYIDEFKAFARDHYWLQFNVTKIGCGFAGYIPSEIAPLFKDSPPNVHLNESFQEILNNKNSISKFTED